MIAFHQVAGEIGNLGGGRHPHPHGHTFDLSLDLTTIAGVVVFDYPNLFAIGAGKARERADAVNAPVSPDFFFALAQLILFDLGMCCNIRTRAL